MIAQKNAIDNPRNKKRLPFQKLAAKCTQRLEVTTEDETNLRALAGRTPDGTLRLLISGYPTDTQTVCCKIPGATEGTLYAINTNWHEPECVLGTPVSFVNGTAEIAMNGKNSDYLLEVNA